MALRVLALLFLSIFTISCGGGGGGGSDSGPPPTPAANVSLSSSASSVAINTSVTLTWSSSNASSCTASGSWSGSKATSGEESVEIVSLGSNSFALSCSGSGGSGQSSLSITGEGFSGVLVDGYIRDANVYLDSNANFIQDTEEASTTTDSEGGFKIGETDATVVSKGGIEVNSNNSLDNLSLFQKQISGQNFRAVTPITSVDFYLEGSETINTILGIEDSMNIYTTDPVANMNDSDSYKHLFEKGSQITALVFSIQSAINDINSVQETSETYFEQLAKTLESQYSLENEVVDIESSSFVDAYVEAVLTSKSVNLGTTNTANVKTSLNSLLPVISVRNETTTTTAISNFATGKFITDFKEIAKGSASPDLINAYASDVNSLIAADQLIDITDLVIEISLADDSASLDEDKTVDIAVLANDTLLTHTYTTFLEFSSPSNGQAILNVDNSISYIPQANFNGSDSFTYTVTIENKSGTANVNIEVNSINDKPSIESLATTLTVDEGKTEVTSISAIDVDGDNLTYSLSGTDASALNISSSGEITFNSAPDYETKTSYSVTVNVSDGTETTSQSLTITINDISDTAPVINDLPSSISIVENETTVLTVSASDPDDDALTYSLTGTDASSLTISSSGVITFNSAPDFETKTSYSVTVNVSGGGETTSQALSINITNVNDIFPVISNLASLISINEGQTAVVTIAASDAEDDTLTYSLTGTDASSLSISSSGVITFNSAPDYETKTSYSITVNVSDGTNTTSQALTINITNVNEGAPVISNLASSVSVDEGQTAVVTVSASDSDGDTLTYSLTGTDASSLSISSSGVITFNSAPDYETKTSYSVSVNVSDGTDTTSQALTINISNINDNNPVINDLASSISVNEGQTSVVTVSASDVDGDTLTYSLTGTDGSSLSISSSGVITFNSAPDYETKTSYSITVNVSDGTNTTSQALTINITNVNEGAPVISNLASSVSVDEGQTAVVTVSASDSDGDTLTYSLSGTDAGSLDISSSGVITFNSAPDYETKTSYSITVNVSDGTDTTSQALAINILNVNDIAPTISSLSSSISVAENNISVVSISASDGDGDTLTYSLTGTDGSSLSISSSGVITFNSAPDYETKTSYSITVNVSDGTNTTSQALTINITNVNEGAPVISNLASSVSVDEGQTAVVTVSASDVDGDTLTYSLTGTDAGSLSISSSGVITFSSAPDYETKTSYSITVNVSDGTDTTSQAFAINITDINDNAPVISGLASSLSVAENQTAVVTVSASDADGNSLTYSLTGTDASSLSISSSGVITFNSAPDYETKNSYSITVNVSDGTNTTSQALTINITNVNEGAPVISGLASSLSVAENQTAVVTISASDVDGDALTYSLTGTDAGSLSISSSGVITFNSAPDYETKTSYSVTVNVSGGGETTSQALTINISNINDNAPVISGLASSLSVAENQTAVVTVSASDADGNSLTYSLTGTDAGTLSISSSGVITFNSAPDYEYQSSYSVTVNVSDGTNTTSQALTINITNVSETYNVSGAAVISRYIILDSDVPNTEDQGFSSNSFGNQQSLANPTVVVGHTGTVTIDGVTTTDEYDLFSVQLTTNMYVNLEVSDYESGVKDLDLLLYNADGTAKDFSYASGSTERNETINLPSEGTFLIQVYPVSGESKYVLTLGQRASNASASSYESQVGNFIEDEFISYIPFKGSLPSYEPTLEEAQLKWEQATFPLRERFNSFQSPGLRKLKFDLDVELERNQIETNKISSGDVNLEFSEAQIKYLKHWKIINRLQEEYPDKNIGFNFIVEPLAVFSKDPSYRYQWNMTAIGLEAALNAVGQETKDIVVAVIDSGSPATSSTAWTTSNFISGGYDFVDGDADPTDPNALSTSESRLPLSHGTHVGTTIAAKNDGNDVNGFGVKVLPLRVLGEDGGNTYDMIQAMLYAAGLTNSSGSVAPTSEGPVKVINLSLGVSASKAGYCYEQSAINDVINQGITVVAAAGNEALEEPGGSSYPAACDNVISVGATELTGGRAAYSFYNNSVDIAAPGGNISVDENGDGISDGIPAFDRNERLYSHQGTSMASPHVAGAIAVLHSIDSGLTVAEIEAYLQGGYLTDDIGDSGRDNEFGFGLLNLSKAVTSVIQDQNITTTYATPSPLQINFGFDTNSIDITLTKVGNGTLSVTGLGADDADGLSYSESVDGEGFGTYTIIIDRTGLPDGNYQNTIYFEMSDGTLPATRMTYSNGSERTRPNLGKVWVALFDSSGEIAAAGKLDMDGVLAFNASEIEAGDYYFKVSTDIDNNGFICELGEICDRYPSFYSDDDYFSLTNGDINGGIIYPVALKGFSGLSASTSLVASGTGVSLSKVKNRSFGVKEIKEINEDN